MLDIIFISYDEPYADQNFNELKEKFPYAKRVKGVKGIGEAHKAAATIADTTFFYVVDGDASIIRTFTFEYKPPENKKDYVHIWKAYNAIIDDAYGYGGVKLFSKKFFKNIKEFDLDFSTTLTKDVEYMDEISCNTEFYTSPFHAFRGAYRECTKLGKILMNTVSDAVMHDASIRVQKWLNPQKLQNWEYVQRGAELGLSNAVSEQYFDINNFETLQQVFKTL